MDAGKLNERVTLLTLAQGDGGYAWETGPSFWAQVQLSDRANLFSRVGLGEKTAAFTIRRRELTLHNAILWRGRHCFLTHIEEVDRRYLKITAALVNLSQCALLGEELKPVLTFPAVLTEKYIRYAEEMPMAQTESLYVLVTPKPIVLSYNDLVRIGGSCYAVRACHTLDGFKNEYEVYAREDI